MSSLHLQEGEFILREGEPLTTESKFYIIEKGLVEAWKLFEVLCSSQRHSLASQQEGTLPAHALLRSHRRSGCQVWQGADCGL